MRATPELGDVLETSVRGTQSLMARVVESMAARGALRTGLDAQDEAEMLAALSDGLNLRSVLHPEVL